MIAKKGTRDSDRSGRKIRGDFAPLYISRDEAIYRKYLIFRRFYTGNEIRRDEDCA